MMVCRCGPHDKPKLQPGYLLLHVLCAGGGRELGVCGRVFWLHRVTFDVVHRCKSVLLMWARQ